MLLQKERLDQEFRLNRDSYKNIRNSENKFERDLKEKLLTNLIQTCLVIFHTLHLKRGFLSSQVKQITNDSSINGRKSYHQECKKTTEI